MKTAIDLSKSIDSLSESVDGLISERDAWKARAESAEAKLSVLRERAKAVTEYLADPVRFKGPDVLERRRVALRDALAEAERVGT